MSAEAEGGASRAVAGNPRAPAWAGRGIAPAVVPEARLRHDGQAGPRGFVDGVRDIKTVLLGDAEEVKQRAQGGRTPRTRDPTAIIPCDRLAADLRADHLADQSPRRHAGHGAGAPGTRRRGGVIIVPGGSGNWGGGWSGGGGGGWSGGGGGFGGGGASGSW